LILDRSTEQICDAVKRALLAVAATPTDTKILYPGDLAGSDRNNRRGERPERGQVAPVRRPPDDPDHPDSSGNDRHNQYGRPQAANLR
jgi:hypothetical protein